MNQNDFEEHRRRLARIRHRLAIIEQATTAAFLAGILFLCLAVAYTVVYALGRLTP